MFFTNAVCWVFLLSIVCGAQYDPDQKSDETTARTFFYDDHQVFFTMMFYFPFVVSSWSYGIPFTSIEGKETENLEVTIEDAKTTEVNVSNEVLEFSKRSVSDDPIVSYIVKPTAKSRQKRTLYIDDQVINIFICMSLPFSVPLLKYDQDILQAYKNKNARKEFEKHLAQVPTHDTEFESQYNEDDTYGEYDEDDYGGRSFGFSKQSNVRSSGFGTQSNGFGSSKKHETRKPNRRRGSYVETMFEPVSNVFRSDAEKNKHRKQLWSPVNNFDEYDYIKGRSLTEGVEETAELLSAATLVSVDERVINTIEQFPVNCSQRVLCEMGTALTDASPIQALLLHAFGSHVFGYRDEPSNDALAAALDGDDCRYSFESCSTDSIPS